MTTKIYGISTCDTVRKARHWLKDHHIDHEFIDVRESTPSADKIAHWITSLGAGKMVNKRSTTWKNMTEAERYEAEFGDTVAVLLANPTLIKRPVLEHGDRLDVGFKADTYSTYFKS